MAYILGASGEVKRTTIKNPVSLELTEAAAELLARDPLGFLDRYSPNYVYSVIHGGSFLGCVTLNSRETSHTDALKFGFGFSVNLFFFSAGVSVDFTKQVEERKKHVRMSVNSNWMGGTNVSSPSVASPASVALSYNKWSDTWRQHPHELKVVLRKWVDIAQVQRIINNHSTEIQRLFYADTLKPTMLTMLSQENGLAQILHSSLTRAFDWVEVKSNRTLQDEFYALQLSVRKHILYLESMDHTSALYLQGQVAAGNTSAFKALDLLRHFEDMRRELGRDCDEGSRMVQGVCTVWAGTCPNGRLLPIADRTADNQCGNCSQNYVLVDHECVRFDLHEKHEVEIRDNGKNTRVITETVEHHICALQGVAVEDLALNNEWSAAWCRVFPEQGRWRMHAQASGTWTDVSCSSRCLESPYPVSPVYKVSRNKDRKVGLNGISRQTMVPTDGSVCWLSMVSFWQASTSNEWAECTVRQAAAGDQWELQASIKSEFSRTGAECGAVCLENLPLASVSVGIEVVKQWEENGCADTHLGDAENQHCFLTTTAVSHAVGFGQRPSCQVSIQVGMDKNTWTLRTCNGAEWGAKVLCGVRCITFSSR
jgi:hypothetical protein